MSNDDSDHTVNTDKSKDEHLRPITTTNKPISWADSNDARLDGILHNVRKFWRRRHLFVEFFKHRAVPVGSKLAVDSPNAVPFVLGVVADKRDATDRCPPTGKRIADLVTRSPGTKFTPVDPDKVPPQFIIAPHFIDAEDARLLKLLEFVIDGSVHAAKLLDKADGSGTKLGRWQPPA